MNTTRGIAVAILMVAGISVTQANDQGLAWRSDGFVMEEVVVRAEAPASYYMEEVVVTAEAPNHLYMEEIVVTAKAPELEPIADATVAALEAPAADRSSVRF
jgi:hypothetical protein